VTNNVLEEASVITRKPIAIVGLGYVGLTLATVLAETGFRVVGVENRKDVVDKTNKGIPHFVEKGLSNSLERVVSSGRLSAVCDFDREEAYSTYIITVGTPLGDDGLVRLDMIESAAHQVAEHMAEGALIVLRSTVKIGTARNVIAPILKKSGKAFDIAMCPERTLEGNALQELRQLPQIIGAVEPRVRNRAAEIFRTLSNSIVHVSSLEAAEVIKLVDNTYRDVQFAFANEVARVCEVFGVSAHEVIVSGRLGYERTNVPLPGLVGGPCLEKDPHILVESARSHGLTLEISASSRLVNERQPRETVSFIVNEMERRKISARVKITILGMAFKGLPETDDLRGSMSLRVLKELTYRLPLAELHIYDPVISPAKLRLISSDVLVSDSVTKSVEGSSVVIIANNHPRFTELSPSSLKEFMENDGFIYDYWNHFSNLTSAEIGDSYFAVGNLGAGI
jgi:UDP-N-acetyl-D-mannosaminuronic acid dehydrogenase